MVVKPEHGEYEIRSEFHWLQGVGYQDQNGFIYLMFSDPLSFLIERTGEAYTKFDYVKTIDFGDIVPNGFMNWFASGRTWGLFRSW